jgi:C-terminal processing protease CtpA/Prc
METYSVNKATIDWPNFRGQVLAAAAEAETLPELSAAITLALRLLGDHESYYQRGRTIYGPPPVGGCSAPTPTPHAIPDTIGYVRVSACDCAGGAATQFAQSIQQTIKAADHIGLAGWIVDLRGNLGGNMWPMIAGIGPVLGEGIVGWIIYNDREYEREYRSGAATSFGETLASVPDPYTLLEPFPMVAVLTDRGVNSAGEAIAVFFRGRPGSRSFGTETCGHHHLQQTFPVGNGAELFLVSGQHADRTRRRYGGPVRPDEIVSDPADALERAIAWLLAAN